MTLLADNAKLEEQVVAALARNPSSTAEQLASAVEAGSRSYSIQAIYQELRKLERNGLVVRKAKRYSLRLLWLVELSEFARDAYAAYANSDAILAELPEEGRKQSWVLYDLRSLLNLWTDLTFRLLPTLPEEERVLYEYVEHVWFHTANPVNEAHFWKAMKRMNAKYVLISRGGTSLDRDYEPLVKRVDSRYSFGRSDFPARPNQYLSVLGDYLMDVKLSKALNDNIRSHYEKSSSSESQLRQEILVFAAQRGRCTLTVTRDPVRAARERRKFELFFKSARSVR